MAVETELKIRVAPEQLAKLKRHAVLKAYSKSRPVSRRLHNIYFDTPKLQIHNSGMALRLRHTGNQWLQTLTGGGSVQAGLHQRNEWEIPVSGPALDLSLLQAAGWNEQLPQSLQKKLQPVFVTDFSRSSQMLDFQGSQIELCFDQGEISTEQLSMPVCELELELKSGEPNKLFVLALELLGIVPFELESVSKAEKGYRLLGGYTEQPVKSVVPALARTDTLAVVLQKQIWSCLQHFQGNLHGAMASDDAEYLHQMRVALRRLRVVLRMVEKVCPDTGLAELNKEVSSLCIELGRIREWDVFIDETVQPLCERMGGHAGLQALLIVSKIRREASYKTLGDATRTRELQRLLLRFAIWMNGEYWQQAGWQPQAYSGHQALDFSSSRLRKLAKRFSQSGQHLDGADTARLHALRILAKKLRYTAEFFAGLYDRQNTEIFLAALSKVQDVLGRINDIAVAHHLIDNLSTATALADHKEATILARGWMEHSLSVQLIALQKAMRNFNKQPAFWKKY